MERELLLNGLKDAKCKKRVIEASLALEKRELMNLLKREREEKLDSIIHKSERELSILDYLIFEINKEIENESKV